MAWRFSVALRALEQSGWVTALTLRQHGHLGAPPFIYTVSDLYSDPGRSI